MLRVNRRLMLPSALIVSLFKALTQLAAGCQTPEQGVVPKLQAAISWSVARTVVGSAKWLCFILQVAYARRLTQACTEEQSAAKDRPLVHFCEMLLQVRFCPDMPFVMLPPFALCLY